MQITVLAKTEKKYSLNNKKSVRTFIFYIDAPYLKSIRAIYKTKIWNAKSHK